MFHTAVAARLGLGATEEKTLDLLERLGPLSPGELSRRTGSAPASVTGVLDRLQRRGFVTRGCDPQDGRKLLVQINQAHVGAIAPLFADLTDRLTHVYEDFGIEELVVITRFLRRTADVQRSATQQLSEGSSTGITQTGAGEAGT